MAGWQDGQDRKFAKIFLHFVLCVLCALCGKIKKEILTTEFTETTEEESTIICNIFCK